MILHTLVMIYIQIDHSSGRIETMYKNVQHCSLTNIKRLKNII